MSLLLVLDSTGKLPDGIFSGTVDFCESLRAFSVYAPEMVTFTCESEIPLPDGTTFSLSFLKKLPPIPHGNTKAWGSVKGCISAKRYYFK